MRYVSRRYALLAVLLLVATPHAQSFKAGTPESVGMSAERLSRIRTAMQAMVEANEMAGVETLVARRGVIVHHERIGVAEDAIFGMASMTKPVTSVAIMMLLEDGKLLVSDPVSRFIPAFREMRVLAPKGSASNGDEPGTVPAQRQITIDDLLTHTSGLVYGFLERGPLGEMYKKSGIYDGLGGKRPPSLAEQMELLARQPLKFQPGTAYTYSISIDVLGRIVEVASGQSLEEFFRTRIFEPLGMRDTTFSLPAGKASRLATLHAIDEGGLVRAAEQGNYTNVSYFSGGAGLVSTGRDYLRFAQMLLNGGQLDSVRLLSRKTVELMTTSHTIDIGPSAVSSGYGFGYGFSVRESLGLSSRIGSEGMYTWSGILGTYFWVDPKEQLAAVMMLHLFPRPDERAREVFTALTYAAIQN
jgi:CubicO group peptidase (beta-lactamase class C family)